jgi:hypothetical protein
MLPLHLSWTNETGDKVYRGADAAYETRLASELPFGVLQPDSYSESAVLVLENTAQERRLAAVKADGKTPEGTAEKFIHVRLYLAGDADTVKTLLIDWPALEAGVEVSFDRGVTWTRLSLSAGHPDRPDSWITLPGRAVCEGAADGELGPFPPYNRATVHVRVKTPRDPSVFGLHRFSLVPDCDVL